MGVWSCTHLPWHRFVIRRRVSEQSEKVTCSCGRSYGINHDVRVILPWDDVKSFYDDGPPVRSGVSDMTKNRKSK